MAEQVNYTQYYPKLKLDVSPPDWSGLKNPKNYWAIVDKFQGSYLDYAGDRSWSNKFTKQEANDVEFLRKYIKASGIISDKEVEDIRKSTELNATDFSLSTAPLSTLKAIIGAYAMGHTGSKPSAHTKNINSQLGKLSSVKDYVTNLDTLTKNLESYGATPAEIQTYLENKTWSDTASLTNTIKNLENTWDQADQNTEKFKALLSNSQKDSLNSDAGELGNILITKTPSSDGGSGGSGGSDGSGGSGGSGGSDGSGGSGGSGGGPGITPRDEATVAVATADNPSQTATTATQSAILGDSTLEALRDYVSQNEGYTLEEDAKNNTYTVKDADGNTVDKFAVDEKNNQIVYVGGEKDGQRFSTGGLPERIDTYQDVEDTTFADQQALADEVTGLRGEYADYSTSVLGGDVTEGVAQQLGWTKTATGWTDPLGKDYTVNKETGILESGGVGATTKGTFEDADFAGQINAQLNQFLTGKDANGNDILDEEGNPIKGFLDYQGDLEGAANTYKTDMQGLSSLYDQTYGDYANELDPLRRDMGDVRDRLGQVAQGQMDVARDASDRSYYNNLRDTLYADSADQLNRQTEAGMDSIRQSFAASGADPTSPAFVAAMKDLQQSRSDAMVGARRKAILDSYGLGSQMLGNRTNALAGAGNALGSEMSGIGSEMGALDSLYGVKLEGLNTRRDMIGQIYGAEKDKANIGVSGLNTVLDTGLKGIAADQNQFNTKLNLNNDFYNNLFKNIGLEYDVKGGLRDYADKETTSAFDTLVDYDQSFKSDDFTMGSFQLALQQAYPDGNIPEPLQNLIDKYSSK